MQVKESQKGGGVWKKMQQEQNAYSNVKNSLQSNFDVKNGKRPVGKMYLLLKEVCYTNETHYKDLWENNHNLA